MSTRYEIEEESLKEIVKKEVVKIPTVEIRGGIRPLFVDWNYYTSISFNNQNIEIPF